ncbi:MAG: BPSL0067 family protein [Thermoleophilia bacterium]|nr:BPSL0067 family protein [Thermoleophilia bacterium]
MSYLCSEPPADIQGKLVDDGKGNYLGQCVSLLKRTCATIPATTAWKKGKRVKDVTALARLTAIATFNDAGQYAGHAAIYVSQDKTGIWVWDQYKSPEKPVGKRLITFDDKKTDVNNGNKYYVIE